MHAKSPKPLDYCGPTLRRRPNEVHARHRSALDHLRYFAFWPITNFARSSISSGGQLAAELRHLVPVAEQQRVAGVRDHAPRPISASRGPSGWGRRSRRRRRSRGRCRSRWATADRARVPALRGVDVGGARLGVDVLDQRVHLLGRGARRASSRFRSWPAPCRAARRDRRGSRGSRRASCSPSRSGPLSPPAPERLWQPAQRSSQISRAWYIGSLRNTLAVGGHALQRQAARGLAARLLLGARLGVGGIAARPSRARSPPSARQRHQPQRRPRQHLRAIAQGRFVRPRSRNGQRERQRRRRARG